MKRDLSLMMSCILAAGMLPFGGLSEAAGQSLVIQAAAAESNTDRK